MNILVSSTRQWNPGDEFILFGVRNLLREVLEGQQINWLLYDRNPDLFVDGFDNPMHKKIIWSNVFHDHDPRCVDLAVVTGTPEWFGMPMKCFYEAVRQENIPLILLGAGYVDTEIHFIDDELYCFKNLLKIATVRDEYASRELKKISIPHEILPCPALFASIVEDVPSEIKRIGFIIQTNKTINQLVSDELSHASISMVKRLRNEGFDVDVICHYIDEFSEFARNLSPIRYSYDAVDYIGIIGEYDLIISTRLHGAILANSLGMPAILLSEDSRCIGAARHFPFIYICDPTGIMEGIKNIRATSLFEIKEWKTEVKEKYLSLLDSSICL